MSISLASDKCSLHWIKIRWSKAEGGNIKRAETYAAEKTREIEEKSNETNSYFSALSNSLKLTSYQRKRKKTQNIQDEEDYLHMHESIKMI